LEIVCLIEPCGGDSKNYEVSRLMFWQLLPIVLLGFAIFLGMIAAERLVALTQKRWRYSLRGLMILVTLLSIVLAAFAMICRI
jgi:hypothetical protein